MIRIVLVAIGVAFCMMSTLSGPAHAEAIPFSPATDNPGIAAILTTDQACRMAGTLNMYDPSATVPSSGTGLLPGR
jgi:hypothetical protein